MIPTGKEACRESIDHPDASTAIQDECSTRQACPRSTSSTRLKAARPRCSRASLTKNHDKNKLAADGVTCSVLARRTNVIGHQQTFNGNVVIAATSDRHNRPGIRSVRRRHRPSDCNAILDGRLVPQQAAQIRDAGLCGSCHTCTPRRAVLPANPSAGCPSRCHSRSGSTATSAQSRPASSATCPKSPKRLVTALYGPKREGMHRHVFVGGNFLMEQMLIDYRNDLDVSAQPEGPTATNRTQEFLRTQSARLDLLDLSQNQRWRFLRCQSENLTGHKLPTAYFRVAFGFTSPCATVPGGTIFESGALNPDGSITGTTTTPTRFVSSRTTLRSPVPTRSKSSSRFLATCKATSPPAFSAVRYLKDNECP